MAFSSFPSAAQNQMRKTTVATDQWHASSSSSRIAASRQLINSQVDSAYASYHASEKHSITNSRSTSPSRLKQTVYNNQTRYDLSSDCFNSAFSSSNQSPVKRKFQRHDLDSLTSNLNSGATSAFVSTRTSRQASPKKVTGTRLDVSSAEQVLRHNYCASSYHISRKDGKSVISTGNARIVGNSSAIHPVTTTITSPYEIQLPRGKSKTLDLATGVRLYKNVLQEEMTAAQSWLDTLDWVSAKAYEMASEEAAIMEEEFNKTYGTSPPNVPDFDNSLLVRADTILSMVENAWQPDSEDEHEISIGSKPMQVHQRSSKPKKEDAIYNVRYKTLPCMHWQKNKLCPAGSHCHFAHGPQELRQPQRHPKFKTQPCQNFVNYGVCLYGDRCFFRHDEQREQKKE